MDCQAPGRRLTGTHANNLEYSMIISLAYAKRLIKSGKATIVAICTTDDVEYYVIDRHDLQRTDHAEVNT
jgi:hypothetical protein